MNRKIKFRAWHTAHKKMYAHENLSVLLKNTKDDDLWKFMQFTGMTDCQNKEIYDGDIIEFDEKEWGGKCNIFVVEYDEKEGQWSLGGGGSQSSDREYRTVIGNIYENKELLKKIK